MQDFLWVLIQSNNTEQNSTCSKWNWKPQMRKRGLNWCPLSNRVKEIRLTSHFSWINLVLQYGFVHSGTQCSHRNHLLAEALLQITGGSYFPHLMGHHFAHSASCREGEKGVTFTFHLLTTSLTNILHFTHTSDCETILEKCWNKQQKSSQLLNSKITRNVHTYKNCIHNSV